MKRISTRVLILAIAATLVFVGGAIAQGQITGRSIKNNSITGKDIKNKTLTRKDFKGSVRGPRGAAGVQGARGPQGLPGPQGPAGQAGGPGLAGVVAVDSPSITIPPGGSGDVDADCPPGKVVIGTGFFDTVGDTGFVKGYTYFVGAVFHNDSGISIQVHAQAICASVSGAAVAAASSSKSAARRAFRRDVRRFTARAMRQR